MFNRSLFVSLTTALENKLFAAQKVIVSFLISPLLPQSFFFASDTIKVSNKSAWCGQLTWSVVAIGIPNFTDFAEY